MIKKNFLFTVTTIFISHIFYAQSSSLITINDTRWTNDTPNFFEHGIRADFKNRSYIRVPGDGMYSTNLSIAQWEDIDNSGGKNHQLNFNDGGVFYRNAYPLDSQWGNWQQLLMTNVYGNVGIGTTNPVQKLTVVGNQTQINQGAPTDGQNSTAILRLQSSPNGAGEVLDFGMNIKSYGWIQPQDFNDPNAFYNLIINSKGGNVGIGTTTPDSKLAVNGRIHSQEVKVDMNGWSDFVFKKEYNLPTLEDVEKHIVEKGHLENILSEKEVLENGINIGEMNAKLLQKIEELTLYIIEIKKENERQNEEIKKIKNK